MDEIKSIFAATAIDDDYVKKYNHVKSGMGKFAPGMYIVQVEGKKAHGSNTLTVR